MRTLVPSSEFGVFNNLLCLYDLPNNVVRRDALLPLYGSMEEDVIAGLLLLEFPPIALAIALREFLEEWIVVVGQLPVGDQEVHVVISLDTYATTRCLQLA